MKKLMTVLILATISLLSYSQTNSNDLSLVAQSLDQQKMNKKDCVMMKNGKMLMMKDGKTMDMTSSVTLNDGSVVSTNGTLTMKDGSTKIIKNGDSIDMNGNWQKVEDMNKKEGENKAPEKK